MPLRLSCLLACLAVALTWAAPASAATPVFVDEIHYDNTGTDAGEAIEVTGPASEDLTQYAIVLYNGGSGATYDTDPVPAGTVQGDRRYAVVSYPANGIQNGAPDAVALVRGTTVVQFLSYEGAFAATNGPASGMTSTDIGVAEAGTEPAGQSLQLTGTGATAEERTWSGPAPQTFGAPNNAPAGGGGGGQTGADGACADAATPVGAVQGPGAASPADGQTRTVEGVVVGDFQGAGQVGGYNVQDAGDGDPATSDGIFVFDAGGPAVAVGDRVRVTGQVDEFFGLTELTGVEGRSEPCGSGTIPAASAIDLPLAGTDRERFEGMLVTFPDTLSVTEHFELGRFGRIVLSEGGTLRTPTEVAEPGDPARVVAAANRDRSISLDDASDGQNPDPPPHITKDDSLRRGETTSGLTGVLTFRRDAYRVDPTGPVEFAEANPRPPAPSGVPGDVRVANFNVLNYFTTFGSNDRGADGEEEFARQKAKIVAAINGLGAEVVALQEIQNNGTAAIGDLVAALNADAGAGTWAAVPDPPNFSETDAIKVGLIYKPARVERVGESVAFPDPAFAGSGRQPVAQTFRVDGDAFSVVANHFKSKGGKGSGADADSGDGQGNFNATRVEQARALVRFIGQLRTASGDEDVLIGGDLNAYSKEDPLDVLRGDGGLVDLFAGLADADRYSYVFDGQQGKLDHALATPSLAAKLAGAAIWHSNADEPTYYDYNKEFRPADFYAPDPYRASDHDPGIVGLDLGEKQDAKADAKQERKGEATATATATTPSTAAGGPAFPAARFGRAAGVRVTARPRLSRGRLVLRLRNANAFAVVGSLRVTDARAKRSRARTLAVGPVRLDRGATRTLSLRVSRRQAAAIRRAPRLAVRLTLRDPSGGRRTARQSVRRR